MSKLRYRKTPSLDLQHGDILSFEELDADRIIISRESLCVCNARTPIEEKKETLWYYPVFMSFECFFSFTIRRGLLLVFAIFYNLPCFHIERLKLVNKGKLLFVR